MCTLGIVMASKYTRQVRATVLEELHQDYVMGARARGLSESHILWREVLPNASSRWSPSSVWPSALFWAVPLS